MARRGCISYCPAACGLTRTGRFSRGGRGDRCRRYEMHRGNHRGHCGHEWKQVPGEPWAGVAENLVEKGPMRTQYDFAKGRKNPYAPQADRGGVMAINPKDRSEYFPYRATHFNGRDGGEINGPGIPEDQPLKMGDIAVTLQHWMNKAFWVGWDAARAKYERKPRQNSKSRGGKAPQEGK